MKKEYFVRVTAEFGTDKDGVYDSKNTVVSTWVSMSKQDAMLLQGNALAPAFKVLADEALKLGFKAVD